MKKKNILIAGLLAVCGFCMFGVATKAVMDNQIVYAEGEEEEEISSEVEEEEEVLSEEKTEETSETEKIVIVDSTEAVEETTNKFKQIWENNLLPAILSINIGTIVATVTSMALAFKNHKTHSSYKVEVVKIIGVVVELSKQMAQYVVALSERNEQVKNLLDALKDSYELTEKQMMLFNEQKESYENLKKAAVGLINIETEIAKASPEFVQNGTARQIVELKNQLMEIIK